MIDGGSYYGIYLLVVTIYTIVLSNKYSLYPNSRLTDRPVSSPISALMLTTLLALFVGLRPKHRSFVDMYNYIMYFDLLKDKSFHYNSDATNLVFDNLLRYMATNSYDITLFFLVISIIYFFGIFIYSRKLFPNDTLYSIVIYLGAFSTFSYATNGIKAGAAAVIFLCALAYYRSKIICLLLLLLSIGFHHSMILPVIAFIICFAWRNPKVYLIFWIFSFILAVLHITFFQYLFGSLADESGAGYLTMEGMDSSAVNITGFRIDFVFYSLFPIVVGYYVIFMRRYYSKFYNIIYSTYVLINAIWMLCMYANFTNRIAYLSWLMLPLILTYPYFDKQFIVNQYNKLNIIVYIQLGFTLFMTYIYYVFIK